MNAGAKSPRRGSAGGGACARLAMQLRARLGGPPCGPQTLSVVAILVFLCFALIKLPMDIKGYAWRSAHTYARSGGAGLPPAVRRGGMVTLAQVPEVPVNHHDSGALKQVLIARGQVPHLMGFSRAVVRPGQSVPPHHHRTKDEVFFVLSGAGVFYLDGEELQIGAGTTVHVAAGQEHRIDNVSGGDNLVLLYFGISTAQ